MSRKLILSLALATAATIAAASLGSSTADAKGFGGGFSGGSRSGGSNFGGGRSSTSARLTPILNPGRSGHPGHPGHPDRPGHWTFHNHGHWIFRGGRWIIVDEVADAAPEAAPGPCTCLTKTYTPAGLVVFADVCTKEAASARVDGGAADAPVDGKSDATPVSPAANDVTAAPTTTNFAGKTFKEYLAAIAPANAEKN